MTQKDAFDALAEQERLAGGLIAGWKDISGQLADHDSVDLRWQRGSDVKLLLQHLAVREEALAEVAVRLRQLGRAELFGSPGGRHHATPPSDRPARPVGARPPGDQHQQPGDDGRGQRPGRHPGR
jgi:hypothetical protein